MVAEVERTEVPTRDQVPVEETWDLSGLFPDDGAWEAAAVRLPELVAAAASHRGRLGESAAGLAAALGAVGEVRRAADVLGVYAHVRHVEDTRDGDALGRHERALAFEAEVAEATAFVELELLALPPERLAALAADPALADYAHLLADLRRRRPHVRSAEVEEVLAGAADLGRTAADAFAALEGADLDFGRVRDETGAEIELSVARWDRLRRSPDRGVRRAVREAFSAPYLAHRHTLASLYNASVRANVFRAKARRHPSAREAALFADDVPPSVYDGLVGAVRGARPTLERYLELRRRLLGEARLAPYDLLAPLSPEPERRFGYREAVDLVLESVAPVGDRYVAGLRAGFAARWVDVHETRGKRPGWACIGAYGTPPAILINWGGTMEDVLALTHEAGHAMHFLTTDVSQPYHYSEIAISLSEIAATVHETLLIWHLLDRTPPDNRRGRFALLNRFADNYLSLVVRNVMGAEFEARTHAQVEAGEPLTLDGLNQLYGELSETYTPGVEVDDAARFGWHRMIDIPQPFYVYQYATGLSAALALARALRDEGAPTQERYLALLAAGASDYPLPLLRRAGVDLAGPGPVEAGLAEFARVVAEMEQLVEAGALEPAVA